MGNRADLGAELRALLNKPNVYFQPPESVKLSFPCFIYHLESMNQIYADDKNYLGKRRYEVIYVTKDPDDELVDRIVNHFELIRFNRFYTADNLNHYAYSIYW